mmetsp:Transcript_5430/g.7340  ORF Transcript_5430/g.7340 Transcript_5430/m.7340 type:complete len:338 (-) Transcript_5430:178-1191(-)|eukprot:CAMPEP_0196572588 /NCGR_PEP_ID=MMETSP1081-20130531/2610_1 /TAXON_ID=36882 /ORGANISM="Pyramimonas amylifera, Strain CCMP720" /LENGTH=337 /DNA_ID=CAMNT_0041889951 /DNA_START=147 /DNA_END=1160 /DNA_ORIENTATION=+
MSMRIILFYCMCLILTVSVLGEESLVKDSRIKGSHRKLSATSLENWMLNAHSRVKAAVGKSIGAAKNANPNSAEISPSTEVSEGSQLTAAVGESQFALGGEELAGGVSVTGGQAGLSGAAGMEGAAGMAGVAGAAGVASAGGGGMGVVAAANPNAVAQPNCDELKKQYSSCVRKSGKPHGKGPCQELKDKRDQCGKTDQTPTGAIVGGGVAVVPGAAGGGIPGLGNQAGVGSASTMLPSSSGAIASGTPVVSMLPPGTSAAALGPKEIQGSGMLPGASGVAVAGGRAQPIGSIGQIPSSSDGKNIAAAVGGVLPVGSTSTIGASLPSISNVGVPNFG